MKKLQIPVPRTERGSTTGARALKDMTALLDCPTPWTMECRILKIQQEGQLIIIHSTEGLLCPMNHP